jgi:plasmanylethanolamine desaturase
MEDLRHNHRTTLGQQGLSAVFITMALAGLGLGIWRLGSEVTLSKSAVVMLILVGWLLADFLSGLLHWAADTWGRVDMPVLGRRLLHPFRVHHINPHDILGRGFLDLNGDVAAVCLPFLVFALWLPLEHPHTQALSLLLIAAAGFALPTNQIHQWAHMPRPPRWVRWLQAGRLVLTQRGHAQHHANPAGGHYCITTGWCNAPLTAACFYVALERIVTATTGCQPRSDPHMALAETDLEPGEGFVEETIAVHRVAAEGPRQARHERE